MNDIIYGADKNDTLKYFIESAHDTQLMSTLLWLEPMDFDIEDMPFSSSMYFEVHYNSTCLEHERDTSCFTVEIYFNNKPLKLEGCLNANKARGSTSLICKFDDFI